jgi:D-glycero-D-manno-heptose 1,7-bisphosphate phosphatase
LHKAVFLDRDGIINVDKAYVYKKEDFEFCEGVFEALKHFQTLGYILIVVTNQSGIARGYYRHEDFANLTSWMREVFSLKGIHITDVFHCPHLPDFGCECRKPNTKMFQDAFTKYDIDPQNSWMIGDKKSDIQAAINANIPNTIFVNTLTCKDAKYNVKSILDTINIINE